MTFDIYKRGQGKYTRLGSAFGGAIIGGLGSYTLYNTQLRATDLSLWAQVLVPVGLFVALCVLLFWLVNKASVADFMIAAEGEMKKVSWSSRQEITVSTIIVIVVVVLMAGLIGVTDVVFQVFFRSILI